MPLANAGRARLPHGALVLEEAAARHGSPYGRMQMRRILKAVILDAMLGLAGNDVRAQSVRLPSALRLPVCRARITSRAGQISSWRGRVGGGTLVTRRVPRFAQRRVILFFWPTRASSANQISIVSQ